MFTALLIPVHTFYLFHHPVLDGFEGWMGHRIYMDINKEFDMVKKGMNKKASVKCQVVKVTLADNTCEILRATADVVIDGQIGLTGLRVIEGINGLFVGYPTYLGYSGEDYVNIYFPVTKVCRKTIEDCVLREYKAVKMRTF
jgi:stage V sporulation protein G